MTNYEWKWTNDLYARLQNIIVQTKRITYVDNFEEGLNY